MRMKKIGNREEGRWNRGNYKLKQIGSCFAYTHTHTHVYDGGGERSSIQSVCVHTGKVNLKVSAEALKTDVLCGNEVAAVPDAGRVDTVVRTLLVEVSDCHTRQGTSEQQDGRLDCQLKPQRTGSWM